MKTTKTRDGIGKKFNPLPRVTIVIPTFNGNTKLNSTLDSIFNLDYPTDHLQIIVVDDHSINSAENIVREYDVEYFRHSSNLGVCSARNTGLRHARYEYFTSIDDDCLLEKQWLIKLVGGFENKNIAGNGGYIHSTSRNNKFLASYLTAIGYGLPTPLYLDSDRTPIQRLKGYLKDVFSTRQINKPVAVRELMGANALFKTSTLRKVGGWDVDLLSSEDVDLCYRIKKEFPNSYFKFTPSAVMEHSIDITPLKYIRRAYVRTEYTYAYYKKSGITPPIMPFPFIVLGSILLVFLINIWLGFIAIIVIPPIVYIWWMFRLIKERRIVYALFAYFEMFLHTVIDFRLMRMILATRRVM